MPTFLEMKDEFNNIHYEMIKYEQILKDINENDFDICLYKYPDSRYPVLNEIPTNIKTDIKQLINDKISILQNKLKKFDNIEINLK